MLVVDQLGYSAHPGADSRDAAGHGFECCKAEGLHLAGHEHEVGKGEEFVDVVLLADEVDAILNFVVQGELLCSTAVGAVSDEHETCGKRASDAGEDFDDISHSLDGTEVREVNEKMLIGCSETGTHGGDEFGFADVEVAVDEVVDDFDLGGDLEGLTGAVAKMTGDSGDAVGLLDAEFCDGKIRVIETNECDVRAVERSDEGKRPSASGEHLAGEERTD